MYLLLCTLGPTSYEGGGISYKPKDSLFVEGIIIVHFLVYRTRNRSYGWSVRR